MPKPKFTRERIAYTLKQAEGDTAVAELRRFKQLEKENKKLRTYLKMPNSALLAGAKLR